MKVTSTQVLVWGIVAIATCDLGIFGIIFGNIGKKRARVYVAENELVPTKVKVGAILSKVGFIIGIVTTVVYAVLIPAITIIAIVASIAGS